MDSISIPPIGVEKIVEDSLDFEDEAHNDELRRQLNEFHKRGSFCDVNLVVGEREVSVHRVVLAAASSFFFDLFMKSEDEEKKQTMYKLKDVDWEGFQPLINYMYTGRLIVASSSVCAVYKETLRLRLEEACKACAGYLATRLTPENCLGIRAIAIQSFQEKIDEFISQNVQRVSESKKFYGLPRIAVEIVGPDEEKIVNSDSGQMFDQVLAWIKLFLTTSTKSLQSLSEQVNVLYLNSNGTLSDALEVEDQAIRENELVQDYKKLSKRKHTGHNKTKEQPTVTDQNGTAFRKFNINPENPIQEMEWSIIGSYKTKDRTFLAIAMVNGTMTTISVHYLPKVSSTNGEEEPHSPIHELQTNFNDEHATFTPLKTMSTNRCAFGLRTLNNQLFACGGYDRGECMNTSEMYDFDTNTWTTLGAMNCPRGRFCIADYDNKIYACGGSSGHKDVKTLECYDPDEDKWTIVCNAPKAKASPGLVVLDGWLYVVGGCMGQTTVVDCEAYNLTTKEWKSIAPLKSPRFQVAVIPYRNKLFAVGGTNGWKCLNEVEIYDPEVNAWQVGPPLNICRRGAGMAIVKDMVFVVGGNDGESALCSTEIYDPEAGAWVMGPLLSIPRANVGVATLGTKLFAVGGFSGHKFLNSLEYLDVSHRDEWCSYLPLKVTKSQDIRKDETDVIPEMNGVDSKEQTTKDCADKQRDTNLATREICQSKISSNDAIPTGPCSSRNA